MNKMKAVKHNTMLVLISEEIDKREDNSVDILRLTYRDYGNVYKTLHDAKSPFDLFTILKNRGSLSDTNVKILHDTVLLLHLPYVKELLERNGHKSNQTHEEITMFTPFRQRVVRFAMSLSGKDIENICSIYGIPKEKRKNQWAIIHHLEDKVELSVEKERDFAKSLNNIGINTDALLQPVEEAFAEEELSVQNQARPNQDPSDTFKKLINRVIEWFHAFVNINKLKVLITDVLKNGNIEEMKDFDIIFEMLYLADKLNENKLNILYEIIKCTGQMGLLNELRQINPSVPEEDSIEFQHISAFRLKLVKFGNALNESNLNAIDRLFNFPRKRYEDVWSMILHLENVGDLTDHNLPKFIEKLKDHRELNHVVEALNC